MQDRRIALITGANQGIGLQVAKELSKHNIIVLIGSRNLERGEAAAKEIGREAMAIQIDVTDTRSIDAAANRIGSKFGRLDILVNNAAISNAGKSGRSLEQIIQESRASTANVSEMRAVFETNVFGVVAVTQAMLPLLKNASGARIFNVSSGAGSLALNSDPAFPYRSGFGLVYAASKTALNAVTLSFVIDLESSNIKVNAVSPGFTKTALNNFQGTATVEQGASSIVRDILDEDLPNGKFTGPEGEMPW